ncbi:hypothetical protein BGZ83_003831 [Gryganskiella cystojenkinii]|nr:hypothetical protein BGZ83_003831 [Gryganskiella cystojenkinii]
MSTATAPRTIKIDIVSDTACPWCYVGKKRLEKAITSFKTHHPENKDVQFAVNWHPYQLDPTLSKTPLPKMQMYAKKFGADRAPLIRDRMIQVGKEEGINFTYNGSIVNTLDSHRLIAFAAKKGKQDEIVEELFKDYFEQDKCGEIPTLIESAARAGLDREEVKQFLESDQGVEEIQASIEQSKSEGIHGVPNITIQDKYVLSGAQDPETFEQVFNRLV